MQVSRSPGWCCVVAHPACQHLSLVIRIVKYCRVGGPPLPRAHACFNFAMISQFTHIKIPRASLANRPLRFTQNLQPSCWAQVLSDHWLSHPNFWSFRCLSFLLCLALKILFRRILAHVLKLLRLHPRSQLFENPVCQQARVIGWNLQHWKRVLEGFYGKKRSISIKGQSQEIR